MTSSAPVPGSAPQHPLVGYWFPTYIEAARVAFPDVCRGEELAVGFKLSSVTGETHGGYFWPLVNALHSIPVLHEASTWKPGNTGPCPSIEGDGLCLVPSFAPICEATSGGARFSQSIGHVLVYPAKKAKGHAGKLRSPWVIQVDAFDPIEMIRRGLCSADLCSANLCSANLYLADLCLADLRLADLRSANLYLADLCSANLYSADLCSANLCSANLYLADLRSARYDKYTIWPAGFDPKAAGAVLVQ